MEQTHLSIQPRVKSVLIMSLPIFGEIALRMLIGNVDQWMLSQYSDTAVAAVGNANQLMNMGLIVLDMVCTATTIILTQYIGAQKNKAISQLYTLSITLIAFLSVLLSSVLIVFRTPFFHWMNVPSLLLADAEQYLVIVAGTLFLQGIFMGISAIFRSHAMMKEIMGVSFLVNIVNVIANAFLINGYAGLPRLGVAGAAIATALSRLCGVCALVWLLIKKLGPQIEIVNIRHVDWRTLKQIMRVGLPAAGDSVSYNCMQIVLLSFINTYGTQAVTAKVYLGTVLPFVYMFASAMATASQIHVGYLVGGQRASEAKHLVLKCEVCSLCSTFVLTVLLYWNSDMVFFIFTQDAVVLSLIRQVMVVEIFLELGRATNMMLIRALLGAGDTTYPLYCALLSMWLVGVPLSYLLGSYFHFGLVGVWIGMAVDEWCRAIAFLVRWQREKWKEKSICKDAAPILDD